MVTNCGIENGLNLLNLYYLTALSYLALNVLILHTITAEKRVNAPYYKNNVKFWLLVLAGVPVTTSFLTKIWSTGFLVELGRRVSTAFIWLIFICSLKLYITFFKKINFIKYTKLQSSGSKMTHFVFYILQTTTANLVLFSVPVCTTIV